MDKLSVDVHINVHYNIDKEMMEMLSLSVTKFRDNIFKVLADVNKNSQPIIITNSRGKNGVLISEDDWNAIQETLYLNSIPGMAESILAGGQTSLEDCLSEDEVEW